MSGGLTAALAAIAAAVAGYALTGLATRAAVATGFIDHPVGYKGHLAPTPYLGGAAVISSILSVTLLLTGTGRGLSAVLACAAGLCLVGTIDDRMPVAPRWRVAAEIVAAGILFAAGVHWSPFEVGVLDFALSAAWVVGVVNAFNLMDNMDGANASVTAVSVASLGVIALSDGQTPIAVASFAVAGACLGFLPHNLAGPARIFLGDGGSMPLGFLVAALSMVSLDADSLGSGADVVLAGGLVAGLPILDTALVVVSRRRRGVPFVTAGRDHLTHRLLVRAGSPRRVAILLALGQSALAALAIGAFELGPGFAVPAAVAVIAAGIAAVAVLESPAWRTDRPAAGTPLGGHAARRARPSLDPDSPAPSSGMEAPVRYATRVERSAAPKRPRSPGDR